MGRELSQKQQRGIDVRKGVWKEAQTLRSCDVHWNTPPKYIALVRNVLGEIDLDPDCGRKYMVIK